MRRVWCIALIAALALSLMPVGAVAKKPHEKPKVDLNAATQVAVNYFVQRRNADRSITAGQVLPCKRRSRLKVDCETVFSKGAPPPATGGQNCSYTATIYAAKKKGKYKAFLKVSPDVCAPI